VVLEVGADAGEINDDRDPAAGQEGCLADTAALEDGGSVDGAGRDDDLASHRDVEPAIVIQRPDLDLWSGTAQGAAGAVDHADDLVLDEQVIVGPRLDILIVADASMRPGTSDGMLRCRNPADTLLAAVRALLLVLDSQVAPGLGEDPFVGPLEGRVGAVNRTGSPVCRDIPGVAVLGSNGGGGFCEGDAFLEIGVETVPIPLDGPQRCQTLQFMPRVDVLFRGAIEEHTVYGRTFNAVSRRRGGSDRRDGCENVQGEVGGSGLGLTHFHPRFVLP
jgi:hypothetical protein